MHLIGPWYCAFQEREIEEGGVGEAGRVINDFMSMFARMHVQVQVHVSACNLVLLSLSCSMRLLARLSSSLQIVSSDSSSCTRPLRRTNSGSTPMLTADADTDRPRWPIVDVSMLAPLALFIIWSA